jgi:hypothetical protein
MQLILFGAAATATSSLHTIVINQRLAWRKIV